MKVQVLEMHKYQIMSAHKTCRDFVPGHEIFSEITLHPSAPLNSPQGASGDTLIGLICIWANKQVVPRGPFCAAFLKNFSGIKGPNINGCHVE